MQVPKHSHAKPFQALQSIRKKENLVMKKSVGASLRYKYIKKIVTLSNNRIFASLWIQSHK